MNLAEISTGVISTKFDRDQRRIDPGRAVTGLPGQND